MHNSDSWMGFRQYLQIVKLDSMLLTLFIIEIIKVLLVSNQKVIGWGSRDVRVQVQASSKISII